MLPERGQFAALWRAAVRLEREGGPAASRAVTLRRLAGAVEGDEPFLRAAVGLEVFAERGLITLGSREDMMILHPVPGRRADLEQSFYMGELRRALGEEEKGGR